MDEKRIALEEVMDGMGEGELRGYIKRLQGQINTLRHVSEKLARDNHQRLSDISFEFCSDASCMKIKELLGLASMHNSVIAHVHEWEDVPGFPGLQQRSHLNPPLLRWRNGAMLTETEYRHILEEMRRHANKPPEGQQWLASEQG